MAPMDRIDPSYTDAVRYLYDRINYEKSSDRPYNRQTFRLSRMEHLLNELGSPQLRAPVIHVAGTKGKGSVSWLLAEALRRSGMRVGLYTSPHLMHLEERFVVDGIPCSPQELVAQIDALQQADHKTSQSEHGQPTFFEMTTALAWSLFAARETDVNVIEVGLGGRLDSTNVCQSALAVITSISFDHQQQLGNTISLIASEKAGIIKKNVPVISGARHPDAARVIDDTCRTLGCQLWQIGQDFDSKRSSPGLPEAPHSEPLRRRFSFQALNKELSETGFSDIPLRMAGQHQGENAAIAIAAWQRLQRLGWKIDNQAIMDSLAETQISCRIEQVASHPTVVIDTAHNVASIEAMINALNEHYSPAKRTIVFACSKDKEVTKMVLQLMPAFDRIILTQFQNNPRVVPLENLEAIAKEHQSHFPHIEILSAPSSDVALRHAIESAVDQELICVAGSFFLAAEIRPLF
jgi:dihydrofolate synthase/folylpolyglutamate synthase